MTMRLIAINDKGHAIGEDHHAAKLSNREVQLLRQLRTEDVKYWTYARLAEKFDINPHHARRLFNYQKRNQAPSEFRRVPDDTDERTADRNKRARLAKGIGSVIGLDTVGRPGEGPAGRTEGLVSPRPVLD